MLPNGVGAPVRRDSFVQTEATVPNQEENILELVSVTLTPIITGSFC
jgi:hypothetical protein